jgi:uridylate kinase
MLKFLNNMKKETIIISLGGSLVVPSDIDLNFLKNFKDSLNKYLKGKKFIIIVGGGKIARNYQTAVSEFGARAKERDWIGINITRLNAEIVKQLFPGKCYSKTITDPNQKIETSKTIIVGAGWKPGWSTDYVSTVIAKNEKIKTIINLTNVDYVYDKNPNQFPDAKPLNKVSWKGLQKIVGNIWTPGLSMPFDPKASIMASKLGLKVIMINGKHLDRLEDFFNNKPFIGTTIQ